MIKVNLIKDKDNYINLFYVTVNGEYNLEDLVAKGFDPDYPSCCRFENGEIYVDEAKKQQLIEAEEKGARIAELRKDLADSDMIISEILDDLTGLSNPVTFVSDFISLVSSFNSKYAQLVKNRKAWRAELEEPKK